MRSYLNAPLTITAGFWAPTGGFPFAPAGPALMNFLDLARAIFGLAFVLGLIGLAAWAARRYAPQLMARLSAERGERRMQVMETLVLDPARRLVLVRVDDEERLILLGEGRELIEPRQPAERPASVAPTPEPAASADPTPRPFARLNLSALNRGGPK